MNQYFVTFSSRYRTREHPVVPGVNPDGFVSLKASCMEAAQDKAFEVFNAYYSGISEVIDKEKYPLGEMYAIS